MDLLYELRQENERLKGDVEWLSSRRRLPNIRHGITKRVRIAEETFYIRTGEFEDGSLGEIFVTSGHGNSVQSLLDQWAIAISIALQWGTPLEDIIEKFKTQKFEPAGVTSDIDLPTCHSIIDYIVRWLENIYIKPGGSNETNE